MEEKKVILTSNTPFLNSQCVFVEYEDIIKCPSFVLINSLKDNETARTIFDFSILDGMDMDQVFEWYQQRKYKNVFKNIPLTDRGKKMFKAPEGMSEDAFLDSFLYQEYKNIEGLIETNCVLNFSQMLPRLFDSYLVHDTYVYGEIYCDKIEQDLMDMYGGKVKYVTGDLKSVLTENKIPCDSTFVFSNIRNIMVLDEVGKLERSSIIIADDFGYNKEGDDLCVDISAMAERTLFKIDFFDNTHSYR